MEKQDICPKCGYKELITGLQGGHGAIAPMKTFSLRMEPLYHVICLNCGTVVRSYVKNPHNLITKKKKEI